MQFNVKFNTQAGRVYAACNKYDKQNMNMINIITHQYRRLSKDLLRDLYPRSGLRSLRSGLLLLSGGGDCLLSRLPLLWLTLSLLMLLLRLLLLFLPPLLLRLRGGVLDLVLPLAFSALRSWPSSLRDHSIVILLPSWILPFWSSNASLASSLLINLKYCGSSNNIILSHTSVFLT